MSVFPHARYLLGAHEPHQCFADEGVEVAFAGRSNSGKSSAINAIVQRHGLARTSKAPGQTQLINFFELDRAGRRLVDLPGYGFAKVPRPLQIHWKRLLETYFNERESLAGLFISIDIRRGIGDQDRQMMDFAVSRGRQVHWLLTKADKVSRQEGLKVLRETQKAYPELTTAQLFSAVAKTGVDEARRVLKLMLAAGAQKKPDDGNPASGTDQSGLGAISGSEPA